MNKIAKTTFFLFAVAIFGMIIALFRQESKPDKSLVFRQECYIWQRDWNDQVRTSILDALGPMSAFTVLAAEIDVRPGLQQRQMIPIDYSFLSGLPNQAGLAIRINPYRGPYNAESEATKYLIQTIQDILTIAGQYKFTPSELQIDYDCAESKLDGYCTWLKQLKQTFSQYPVTITVLPSWMKNREFKRLIRLCDGYVLQVHSLEKPETFDQEVVLCDTQDALTWIQQADRLGVLFRVALPTYGYLVAYDENDRFFGLSAEGPSPGWSQKTRLKTVLSDPKKIAGLIQEIHAVSPKQLSGLIWFRLPIPSDQLNWQWHTLKCIIQEKVLTEKIEAVCEWPEPNLVEIYLVNSGDIDMPGQVSVQLTFEGDCLAGDGVNGYAVLEEKKGNIRIRPENTLPGWRIRSQEKIKIAWCRFSQKTGVKANVQMESK